MPYHPLNRSMGNMFRRNAANSRRSAQAATYTTNQNGSTTAGPQAMQNMVYVNPEYQAMEDWAAGRQPQPQQGAQTLEWNNERDGRPAGIPLQLLGAQQSNVFQPQQVLKQFPNSPTGIARGIGERAMSGVGQIVGGIGRAGSNLGDALFGGSQVATPPPSQPQPQVPPQPQPWIPRDYSGARERYLQEQRAQQRAYVENQQAENLAGGWRQRGASIQSRQQPMQPHEAAAQERYESAVQPAQPQQQGNQYAPPSVDPRDLMPSPARVRQRQAAEQRQTQADQLAGMQGLNAELRRLAEMRGRGETINQGPASLGPDAIRQLEEQDRLQSQQIAATQGGSQDYNIARGRGTPEQEAAFQASLAQQRGQQASQDFAASMPGGEQMNRFAQLQALQSAVNQPQVADATLADRQGLAQAYGERGVGQGRTMVNQNDRSLDYGRTALTGRGNTSREGGAISTGDITGQIDHEGQMISAATAPEYRDAAARNRERINRRRAARGGMSERQARDLSRRLKNPSAVAAYALRNGLENHPMVQSILGGGHGSAVYESPDDSWQGYTGSTTGSQPNMPATPTSAARDAEAARKAYADSAELQSFGVEPGGDWRGYNDRLTELHQDGYSLNDTELKVLQKQIRKESSSPQFWAISSVETPDSMRQIKSFLEAKTAKERREWLEGYQTHPQATGEVANPRIPGYPSF